LLEKSSIINKSKDGKIVFSRTKLKIIEYKINNIIHYLNDEDVLNSYTKPSDYLSLVNNGYFLYSENENEFDKEDEGEYILYNYILIYINKIVKEYNKRKNNLSFLENNEMNIINKLLEDFADTILKQIEIILEYFKKIGQDLRDGKIRIKRGASPAAPGAAGGAAAPASQGAVGGGSAPPKKFFSGLLGLFGQQKLRKTLKVSERRKNTRKVV
jgi:hypothetical protein